MKTVQITEAKSSDLNPQFSTIKSIDIEDTPFDRGAYGEVYISKKINGTILPAPQVVKVFLDDGSGSAKRGLETVEQMQEQIIRLNNNLKRKNEKPVENVIALYALPQFSFKGNLNGKTIIGYSANILDGRNWHLFDKIFNEPDLRKKREYRNNYYNLPLSVRLKMAFCLVEGFSYLEKMNFIYADLNPKNFFVNNKDGHLCLIDYEGGAVMDNRGNTPETYGKLGEWLAPEIQKQLIKYTSGLIKVDLHTDTWAVAIGIHFLLFPYHPLFYLKTRGENEKEYFVKYKWPEIDKNYSNYRQEVNKAYINYVNKLETQIPKEIVRVMSETFNNGYTNPNRRLSYRQWIGVISDQIIAHEQLPPKEKNPTTKDPLLDMLQQNVQKWNEVTQHINQKYNSLIPEEKQAFDQLTIYWKQGGFDPVKCEQLIELLAKGKNKHPTDRDLLGNLQDFRRLCKDYYTRDMVIYDAFQQEMGGKSVPKHLATYLKVNPITLNFEANGSTKTVNVDTDGNSYEIKNLHNSGWCPVVNQNAKSFQIKCLQNIGTERSLNFNVKSDSFEEKIYVEQKALIILEPLQYCGYCGRKYNSIKSEFCDKGERRIKMYGTSPTKNPLLKYCGFCGKKYSSDSSKFCNNCTKQRIYV